MQAMIGIDVLAALGVAMVVVALLAAPYFGK